MKGRGRGGLGVGNYGFVFSLPTHSRQILLGFIYSIVKK